MRALDDLLPYVHMELPDVPDSLAAHYLRLALIEFSRLGTLTERLEIDLQANVAFYPLIASDCRTIHRIKTVEVCGRCLVQNTRD